MEELRNQQIISLVRRFENQSHVLLTEPEVAAYCVGDSCPMAVVRARSEKDLLHWVQESYRQSATINVWGAGHHQSVGGSVAEHDLTLMTADLSDIVEYMPDNQTVTVQCGVTLNELQAYLRQQNQFLPLNPPRSQSATVGGICAVNAYGSLAHAFGTVRDVLLGAKIVLADGQSIKLGGKTVKNVAGYDLAKLFIGSMGTIGIFTEITLKLWPTPEQGYRIVHKSAGIEALQNISAGIIHSNLPFLSCVIIGENKSGEIGWTLHASADASHDQGKMIRQDIARLLRSDEKNIETTSSDHLIRPFAEEDHFFDFSSSDVILKVIVPKSAIGEMLSHSVQDVSFPFEFLLYPGMGVVYLKWDTQHQKNDASLQQILQNLRAVAGGVGGTISVERAPEKLKSGLDVWGLDKSLADWYRKIKKEFDPRGIFVPGRFIGGL